MRRVKNCWNLRGKRAGELGLASYPRNIFLARVEIYWNEFLFGDEYIIGFIEMECEFVLGEKHVLEWSRFLDVCVLCIMYVCIEYEWCVLTLFFLFLHMDEEHLKMYVQQVDDGDGTMVLQDRKLVGAFHQDWNPFFV